MAQPAFTSSTLVLAGHGSSVNDGSSLALRDHAAALRRQGLFAAVQEGFLKEEPSLPEALARATGTRVFVVPFFISEGYFSEEVVPLQLGFRQEGKAEFHRVMRQSERALYYCRPVGTHEGMAAVTLSRARAVVAAHPFPRRPPERDVTLFIAGHGTPRNARSREAVERQADLLRALNLHAAVDAVFMEEQPRIADCISRAATRNVVVVPFFLGDGMHVREDIPILLGEPERLVKSRRAEGRPAWRNPAEKQGKLVWYAPAVGTDPSLAEVIVDRVREAEAWEAP